jgi:hypothetical protein
MVRAVVVHEVGRIGGEQDRPVAIHEPLDVRSTGGIAAQQPVRERRVGAEDDEISRLCDRWPTTRHGQRRLHVELLLGTIVAQQLADQVAGLADGEPRQREIEVGGPHDLVEQLGKLPVVPPALDLVEREVERLLALDREIDDGDLDLGEARVDERPQPLMAAHERARATVPDQRLDEAELIEALAEGLVLGIPRTEVRARVVPRRNEPVDRQSFDVHEPQKPR